MKYSNKTFIVLGWILVFAGLIPFLFWAVQSMISGNYGAMYRTLKNQPVFPPLILFPVLAGFVIAAILALRWIFKYKN